MPYSEILSVRYLPIKRYCLALTRQQRKVLAASADHQLMHLKKMVQQQLQSKQTTTTAAVPSYGSTVVSSALSASKQHLAP